MTPRLAAAACVALAFTLVACGDDTTSSGTDSITTPNVEVTAPAVTAAPPPTVATTTALAELVPAACTTEAILPVVAALFPENDTWNIVEVDVADCQNGYARVFAVADQSSCDPGVAQCLEDEQVFLEDHDGSWEYVTSGTGIDCGHPGDLSPEMIAVCESLGLP